MLTLLIFILTLFLGWVTGIFSAWRRKPKLKLGLISGPTFCCVVDTGRMHEGQSTHRTCFALLLNIRNVGAADTAIVTMQIGYLSSTASPHTRQIWIREPTVALGDFRQPYGDLAYFYPFLLQRSSQIPNTPGTASIPVGHAVTGVCYWEQLESHGNLFPHTDSHNNVRITVYAIDTYHRRYQLKARIPMLSLDEARKFMPEFGMSNESLDQ